MRLKEFYLEYTILLNHFQSFSLLLARIALAYGFYRPAVLKWSNLDATASWFASIGIPLPYFSTLLSASVEIVGVVLLALGLFTRFISLPLMFIMLVAIFMVHLPNGFSAGDNGFEIPLYYLLFLGIFLTRGAGRFSIDYLMFKGDK
jgi:putative oxidoreductase